MAERLSTRCRPTGLDDELAAIERANRAAWRRTWIGVAVAALLGLAVVYAIEAATGSEGVGIGFGFAGLVLGAIAVVSMARHQRQAKRKLAFAEHLCATLVDDFHPAAKLSLDLDLTAHDEGRKRYWTGRSMHGNPKHKYADRWLKLKFLLADGSRVRLVRKADVKTKKGAVQRHKRQLYVHLTPNPDRYGPGPWDVSVLDGLVTTAVSRRFHDPPEELRVRASSTGSTIDLKITQLDADILAGEVVALLEATLSAVHLHRLDPHA